MSIQKLGIQSNQHLLRSTQPFSILKIYFLFAFKGQKHIHATLCVRVSTLKSVRSSQSVQWQLRLLWLLVQLHVRHQDVLLGLLGEAGVSAAVAGPLVGAPRPNSSPTVQVDHGNYQHYKDQASYHDNDQSWKVVTVH